MTGVNHLKAFTDHGIVWTVEGDATGHYIAECPFCGKDKFSVEPSTGRWRCFACSTGTEKGGGNVVIFLRELWSVSDKATTNQDYEELTHERKLLDSTTPMFWGCCKSILGGWWMVPAYGPDGHLQQLYRYVPDFKGKGMLLLPTTGITHYLMGMTTYDRNKRMLWLTEGPWDGMAVWEAMKTGRWDDERLRTCLIPSAEPSSLASSINVLAAAGCGSVGEPMKKYADMFRDKHLVLPFDSDHPKRSCLYCKSSYSTVRHTRCPNCGPRDNLRGAILPPAGYIAVKRAVNLLGGSESPFSYIKWGPDGYDDQQKSGWDCRDVLTTGNGDRLPQMMELLNKVSPVPDVWRPKIIRRGEDGKPRTQAEELIPCDNYHDVVTAWKRPLSWNWGLDVGTSSSLACVASTDYPDDQLWFKMIGPPSCGKTTILEGISTADKYVFANSKMTSLHSGWKTDRHGDTDHSMVAKILGKTFIIKDGDTLLKSPRKEEILGDLRDLYDRVTRTHTGNALRRVYEGPMTMILAGTQKIREIDDSELGQRYLDVVVADEVAEEVQNEIGWKAANMMVRAMLPQNNSDGTGDEAEMDIARRTTGGYVVFLREHYEELRGSMRRPHEDVIRRWQRYGDFVAFLRARPSSVKDDKNEKEMPYRLIKQFTRLGICTAIVMGEWDIDVTGDTMKRVKKVCLDTARGRTFDIVKHLHYCGDEGTTSSGMSFQTGHEESGEEEYLRFLIQIGAVQQYHKSTTTGRKIATDFFRLTPRMTNLWAEVMDD